MLSPILRLSSYEEVLDELVRLTPEGHNNSSPLREAAEKVRKLNFSVAGLRRNAINFSRLLEIVKNTDKTELVSYSRVLLREGPLNEVDLDNHSTENAVLYLFNDCIVLGKYWESNINFEKILQMKDCSIYDEEDLPCKNYFYCLKQQKLTLYSSLYNRFNKKCIFHQGWQNQNDSKLFYV